MTSPPLGLLIGISAMAGVSLGGVGLALALLVTLGFCLLDSADDDGDRRSLLIAITAVATMSLLGVWRGGGASPTLDLRLMDASSVVAVVRSMPQSGGQFDMALVQVETIITEKGERISTSQPVLAFMPASLRVNVGDRIWLGGPFSSLASLEPGFRSYVSGRGAVGVYRAYAADIEAEGRSPLRSLVDLRRDLADRLRRAIPGDAGELAAGIVSGDDSGLSDGADQAFRTVGLSHLTAVSGQNIAMLAGLVILLLRSGPARRAAIVQLAMLVLVWLYVGMTGFGAPAIRAGLFLTLSVVAVRAGRRPDYLTFVALVSGGMLLVEPSYVRSVSFWLSMASSAALVTALGWPSGWIRGWIVRSGAALITAQVATVPIAVAVFGTWSIGSIPANLIAGPLMELAFPLCFALALSLYLVPFIAPIIASLAEIPLAATLTIAKPLADLFPAQDLAAGGSLVLIAMATPCLLAIGLLSEDARRWFARQQEWRSGDPVGLVALGVGLLAGGAMTLLIVAGLS